MTIVILFHDNCHEKTKNETITHYSLFHINKHLLPVQGNTFKETIHIDYKK